MNLSDLLEEFNVVINTPEGLIELRSLILGLAVRGKLVHQDPNDEPASELLEKIEAEKKRLYEEGEIRKPKKLKKITKEKELFEIPDNWIWVKLGQLFNVYTGDSISRREKDEKYIGVEGQTYLGTKDVNYGFQPINYQTEVSIPLKDLENFNMAPKGSVLVCSEGGSAGKKCGYVEENVCFGNKLICNVPYYKTDTKLLLGYMQSDLFRNQFVENMTGIIGGISQTKYNELLFPLPPLAEQHRIVQKIESLFAEVDELETKLNRQAKLEEKLQVAVNAEVQQASDADATKSAWTFITDNFDTLYHTPEAIDNLKKNILNEAVRGRLVPQNHNDEPASELLKKIEAEKQRLYDEGEILKPKDLPPVKEDEIPFEIPKSWEWCRFGDLASKVEYGTSQKAHKEPDGIPVLRMGNIDENGNLIFDSLKYVNPDIKDLPRLYLKNDDLIFNRTNSYELVGKMGLFKERDEKFTLASYLIRSTLLTDIYTEYIHYYFNSLHCRVNEIEPEITKQTNQANFNGTKLQHVRVPLPAKEEQHRIVRRIEELFAICDRFKARLQRREMVNEWLLKGLFGEVLEIAGSSEKESVQEKEISDTGEPKESYKPLHKVNISVLWPPENSYFVKRKMLGCYIINQSLEDENFGDTKFEKLLHLADYWAVQRNLNQKYYQQAAGPYDNVFTNAFFNQVVKAKWFKKIPQGDLNRIVAGEKHERSTNYYNYFTEKEFQGVDLLIHYFRNHSYEQPEIVSTLYAVWNNRNIRNQHVNDELIKKDFLKWGENKKKYNDRLDGALHWMRNEGMVPNGWGKIIDRPKSKK